jgi:hypothetical protein
MKNKLINYFTPSKNKTISLQGSLSNNWVHGAGLNSKSQPNLLKNKQKINLFQHISINA